MARGMLQGRVQSIGMQERNAWRDVFRQWDRNNNGELNVDEFYSMLQDLSIPSDKADSERILNKLAKTKPGVVIFNEWLHDVIGLPPDFFSADMTSGGETGIYFH